MKRTGAIFNHRNRGANVVGRHDPDPKAVIGLRGKHSLQEFADKDNILTLDDKNTKDYRLVVGNIGDFETAAITKEYRRVGLHPNVVRDYDKDGKLIYEVAASFWGDRAGAIVKARKLATGLGSSVQVVVGGNAVEVKPDKAAICEVCSKRLVKTRLGKIVVMACPEFLNGDLAHTSFDVKRAQVDTEDLEEMTNLLKLYNDAEIPGAEFVERVKVIIQPGMLSSDNADKLDDLYTTGDAFAISNFMEEIIQGRIAVKQSACISIKTWGDDEDIMIWTKNEGPGGEMMFGKKRADWDKIDIQTKDGFVEVYLGEGDKLLSTADGTVISPTDLITPGEYDVAIEELKNGIAEKEAATSLLDDVEDTIVNYDIDVSDQNAATDKVFEQLQSTWSGLTRDEVTDAVKMWVERQGRKNAQIDPPAILGESGIEAAIIENAGHFMRLIVSPEDVESAIQVLDQHGWEAFDTGEASDFDPSKQVIQVHFEQPGSSVDAKKKSMTFTYGPEESAQDDNVEYHVNLQGYYLPSGNPPTDLNQLLSPDILARIDFTEMKEDTYESGGYWSGWDWWNGASEAGRAELLRNLEGTPLAMLATGAEFLAQLEWMIIKTLIYRLAGGSATGGDKLIEDYVKPATNPDEPYAGTDVQLYIRLRGTMALGALVDALDETAGWNWADIRDSFGYIGDWWAGDDYGYYDSCYDMPMYASLKPLLEKVRWAAGEGNWRVGDKVKFVEDWTGDITAYNTGTVTVPAGTIGTYIATGIIYIDDFPGYGTIGVKPEMSVLELHEEGPTTLQMREDGTLSHRKKGEPKTDEERLQTHFGDDWENHDVSELPERGTGLDDDKEAQQQQVKDSTHLKQADIRTVMKNTSTGELRAAPRGQILYPPFNEPDQWILLEEDGEFVEWANVEDYRDQLLPDWTIGNFFTYESDYDVEAQEQQVKDVTTTHLNRRKQAQEANTVEV